MRHLTFIVLALALAILPVSMQARQKTAHITMATYNLRYINKSDPPKGNNWERRCPWIAKIIQSYGFEVFGTQEGYKRQLEDLKALLPGYEYFGRGREDGVDKGEHSAIFYRTDLFQLIDHGDFWLSETPDKPGLGWDAACIRICTWGHFRHLASGREFLFFSLHMDHVGKKARMESARLVMRKMQELGSGLPAILVGDFNVDQNDEIYHIFLDSDILDDTYEEAKVLFAENGTFNAFDPELRTFSRIDHVFVSTNFEVDRYGVLTNSYWVEGDESGEMKKAKNAPQEINFSRYVRRLPSDHYPVFVHLRF